MMLDLMIFFLQFCLNPFQDSGLTLDTPKNIFAPKQKTLCQISTLKAGVVEKKDAISKLGEDFSGLVNSVSVS